MSWLSQIYMFIFSLFITIVFGREFKRVCYFTNWSGTRADVKTRFHIGDIQPELCTHLIYAFASIDVDTKRLKKSDQSEDNGSLVNKKGTYFDFTNLKKKYPHLKTMLSVGGENTKGLFTGLMDSSESINQFAENIRIYLYDRSFDGIDIDWEFPGKIYKNRFTEFLQALRYEFDDFARKGNPRMLLSIAASPGKHEIDVSYNVSQISKYVDFINVMAYDYYGTWSHNIGYSSPLYTGETSTDFTLTQNWTMHYYQKLGAPAHKLVMGITATAAGFILKDPTLNKPGSAFSSVVPDGPVLKAIGRRSYQQMCYLLGSGGFEEHWDEDHVQTYAVRKKEWYGYETERSIREKVEYAVNAGLGGVMFWSLDIDDFSGNFCKRGRYPLLSTLAKISIELTPPETTTNMASGTGNMASGNGNMAGGTGNPLDNLPFFTTTEMRGGFRMFYVIDSSTRCQSSFIFITLLSVVVSLLKYIV